MHVGFQICQPALWFVIFHCTCVMQLVNCQPRLIYPIIWCLNFACSCTYLPWHASVHIHRVSKSHLFLIPKSLDIVQYNIWPKTVAVSRATVVLLMAKCIFGSSLCLWMGRLGYHPIQKSLCNRLEPTILCCCTYQSLFSCTAPTSQSVLKYDDACNAGQRMPCW